MNGLCECGCGNPAPIATQNRTSKGHIKGQPVRFIMGHNGRGQRQSAEIVAIRAAANRGKKRNAESLANMSAGRKGKGVTHGMSNSPEYGIYANEKYRCTNPKNKDWEDYGGRGIKFLFTSFEQFFAELGPRPSPQHSVDRIDDDGNYEPGNVRWATASQQNRNRRPFFNPTTFKKGRVYCRRVMENKHEHSNREVSPSISHNAANRAALREVFGGGNPPASPAGFAQAWLSF